MSPIWTLDEIVLNYIPIKIFSLRIAIKYLSDITDNSIRVYTYYIGIYNFFELQNRTLHHTSEVINV